MEEPEPAPPTILGTVGLDADPLAVEEPGAFWIAGLEGRSPSLEGPATADEGGCGGGATMSLFVGFGWTTFGRAGRRGGASESAMAGSYHGQSPRESVGRDRD